MFLAGTVVPPIVLPLPPLSISLPLLLGIAIVPFASVPIKLPRTRFWPEDSLISTPSSLPKITFAAAVTIPPIVFPKL